MLNKKILRDNKLIFYGLLIVFVDQVLKRLFISEFPSLVLINSTLAFGINFANPLILNILAILLFLFAVYFFQNKKILSLPVVLILSGAVSNLFDRIYLGGVVDYIDLKIWPSFNLADALIFTGSVLLVLRLLKKKD